MRLISGPLWAAALLAGWAVGASAQPAAQTFDIEAYDVDGAKLLQQIDVETAVYPFLGPGRTRDDIEHARQALQKAYADRGFQSVVVELPPQSVSDNIVRLHVIEASVGRLRVTGSRYFSPETIRREASAFAEGQVPNITQAQAELTEINRLADRRVTPLLRAGQVPGTVDVEPKVSDTLPLHGSVELSNDHSQNTEPLRLTATGHYDNLWQLGHSLTFTYAVAPEDRNQSEIFSGSYLAPLWGTPWSLLAFGYTSNSNVATLGGSNVLGKGYDIGVRAIAQLPHGADDSQSVSFGMDFKDFAQNVLGQNTSKTGPACLPATTTTVVNCPVTRYWPVNLTYNYRRDGQRFTTQASVSVSASLRGLGSDTEAFQTARFSANPEFVHLNLDVTQTEALPHGFEAAQRLSGQISDGPVVSSEQFAAGGFTSVRGYLQSEVVGDDGFTGSLELRSPSLASDLPVTFGRMVDELRLYAFMDGGVARTLDPLPEQSDLFAEASLGAGLRLSLLKHLKGDVAAAVPMINAADTRADRVRITFSLKSDF